MTGLVDRAGTKCSGESGGQKGLSLVFQQVAGVVLLANGVPMASLPNKRPRAALKKGGAIDCDEAEGGDWLSARCAHTSS